MKIFEVVARSEKWYQLIPLAPSPKPRSASRVFSLRFEFQNMLTTTQPPPAAAPGSFANRTVVVSGGTGKLGRVISTALAQAGANLVVNDIKADNLQTFVDSLTAQGHSVIAIPGSATNGDAIIAQTLLKFGRVDAVINATLGPIPWHPLQDLTNDDFRAAFEANTLGPLALTRAAWPHFIAQKYGRVVNFTSDSMLGLPTASAYTMTKGALFGVNKTLAAEGAGNGIKVNCVSPIAYHPNMDRHIRHLAPDIQTAFRELYVPEANVPMVLALASEGCTASGEVFNTAGWAAGRNVWCAQRGQNGLRTVQECLDKMGAITLREGGEGAVFEPSSTVDFTEFQVAYVLGKEHKP